MVDEESGALLDGDRSSLIGEPSSFRVARNRHIWLLAAGAAVILIGMVNYIDRSTHELTVNENLFSRSIALTCLYLYLCVCRYCL
jgi:hypothetical protein